MKSITVSNIDDYNKWLIKNHNIENKVALILYKKHTGKPAPSHRELIEEAICFGWIDTIIKRLDEDRYIRTFTKRNNNSKWSDNTISYAKDLIKQGRMTPTGLKFYKLGLKKPTHDHGIPKNPEIPLELKKALEKNKNAKDKFNNFPPSSKRMIYRWILSGKLQETRKKRIRLAIKAAIEGKKNIF
tara:strand:- start:122 stop:679 length:558 start_codon:yes stop_codon:yes gene_type:complete